MIAGEYYSNYDERRYSCYYAYLVDMSGKEITLYQDTEKKRPLAIGLVYYDEYYNYTSACELDTFFAMSNRWTCNDGVVCVAQIPYTKDGNVIRPSQEDPLYPEERTWIYFEQTGPCFDGVIPMKVDQEAIGYTHSMLMNKDGKIIECTSEYYATSTPWNSLRMVCAPINTEADDSLFLTYRWGLMDANKNWLAEPQYINFYYTLDGVIFHDDLMPIQFENGMWGAINTSGDLVIEAEFDAMSCFNQGFSRVIQDGKCFFIDTNGSRYFVKNLDGDQANITISSKVSNDGLAAVYDSSTNDAFYVDLLAAHNGVVPAVPGSEALGIESYAESIDEEGIPTSMAIPSELVPIRKGELWGFAKLILTPSTNPFTDVTTSDYYYTPVLWALENKITSGTSSTEFSPYESCLRSQVVTFLWRAAGKPAPKSQVNPFEDVKSSDYYYNAVLWAVENGITYGADDTHFEPNGKCSRAQVVSFLYRAFKKPPVAGSGNPFDDVPAGAWYAAAVRWAVQEGIAYGTSKTEFSPDDICNRSQVVTFLHRAYVD